jgi:hypothetical protein
MRRLLKFHWPFLVSAMACVPFYRWVLPLLHADVLANVFGGVLNASAIAAGFLGTALTVVLAMDEDPVIKALHESDTYNELTAYLMDAADPERAVYPLLAGHAEPGTASAASRPLFFQAHRVGSSCWKLGLRIAEPL